MVGFFYDYGNFFVFIFSQEFRFVFFLSVRVSFKNWVGMYIYRYFKILKFYIKLENIILLLSFNYSLILVRRQMFFNLLLSFIDYFLIIILFYLVVVLSLVSVGQYRINSYFKNMLLFQYFSICKIVENYSFFSIISQVRESNEKILIILVKLFIIYKE